MTSFAGSLWAYATGLHKKSQMDGMMQINHLRMYLAAEARSAAPCRDGAASCLPAEWAANFILCYLAEIL